MWLFMAAIVLIPLAPFLFALVAMQQGLGPGPWRCFRWLHPRRDRLRNPFSKGESQLARRVLFPVREVAGLPWSLQRWLYWRVRRFPDRGFRASAWTTALAMGVVLGVTGSAFWGCARPMIRVFVPSDMPRAYEVTWVAPASVLLFAMIGMLPIWIAAFAGISMQREAARAAIRRYATTRAKVCDRCRYPLEAGFARGHVLRCPECGLRHDLRVRAPAISASPGRAAPAQDGPLLITPRRAARLARAIPGMRDEPAEQLARVVEHALWRERYTIMLGRTLYALLALILATAIIRLMWPLIDAAIGGYHRADITGSHTLSFALALVGPAIGVGLWFWLQGRLLRRVMRRAVIRRRPTCGRCGHDLPGLPAAGDQRGGLRCPRCGETGASAASLSRADG